MSTEHTAQAIRQQLASHADAQRAIHCLRFFKTAPGEYGEHDIFWGITMPHIRRIVQHQYAATPPYEIEILLHDSIHEVRACALLLLYTRFRHSKNEQERASFIQCYLAHTRFINNWDLVDMSCGMLGEWLKNKKNRTILLHLAQSHNLWEQRIAIVSTLPLIKHGEFAEILMLVDRLHQHKHDLIHKALGWMLREVGKKNSMVLKTFLTEHCHTLPRTTLRYAIERFPEQERKYWLHY